MFQIVATWLQFSIEEYCSMIWWRVFQVPRNVFWFQISDLSGDCSQGWPDEDETSLRGEPGTGRPHVYSGSADRKWEETNNTTVGEEEVPGKCTINKGCKISRLFYGFGHTENSNSIDVWTCHVFHPLQDYLDEMDAPGLSSVTTSAAHLSVSQLSVKRNSAVSSTTGKNSSMNKWLEIECIIIFFFENS